MGLNLGDTTWICNPCWCFQTLLFISKYWSATNPEPTACGDGEEMRWTSGTEQGLCASNEYRVGRTGLKRYPREKDLSSWQIAKEGNGFSPQQPSPPLLSYYDSALLTPLFGFALLFLVPPSLSLPSADSGSLWFCFFGVFGFKRELLITLALVILRD